MTEKALSFTGHRPQLLPFRVDDMNADLARLEMLVSDEVYRFANEGYTRFYCGGAQGADIIFGEYVLAAKQDGFAAIKLTIAIPFPAYSASWSAFWRGRCDRLLARADERIVVSPDFFGGCYHKRNRFMVDSSQALLAVYDGKSPGGTAYTVDYALKHGKQVVIINPPH